MPRRTDLRSILLIGSGQSFATTDEEFQKNVAWGARKSVV